MPKKIAIFPIDYTNVSLARCAYMGGYEPVALLSPELSVLEGSDIAKLDGGINTNIYLYTDYEKKILESDMVYFISKKDKSKEQLSLQLIEYAKKAKKEVVLFCETGMLYQEYGEGCLYGNEKYVSNEEFPKLLQIEVPIISMFTIGKNCGQLQTEMLARKYFLDKGYKVMQIGSHDFMRILGCLSIPHEMFEPAIDDLRKTLIFNKFVYKQSLIEKPDIILLGVPYPIMKYNNCNLNGLGYFPTIIQNAVKSDIGIVNMHFANYNSDFLKEISLFCKYKLNVYTRYFGIANTSISKNVDNPSELEYLFLNKDFVKNNILVDTVNEKYMMFPVYDDEAANYVFQRIEKELLENPEQL